MEQTRQVMQLLSAAAQLRGEALQLSVLAVESAGDASPTAPLRSLGTGAFTTALDAAVAAGAADVAVHSLKDCPAELGEGLALAACLPRADPRDALITTNGARRLGELMPGSRVGTSSSRRAAQIRHAHPHLNVMPVRGNVDARLARMAAGEMSATVLALSGLQRLGREDAATAVLSTEEMLPAACQGAVGVVCRQDDPWVIKLLSSINHAPTFFEVAAERACLSALLGGGEAAGGGGAFPPLAWACHSQFEAGAGPSAGGGGEPGGSMGLDCLVSDLEGRDLVRYTEFARPVSCVAEAEALGGTYGSLLRLVALQRGWLAE